MKNKTFTLTFKKEYFEREDILNTVDGKFRVIRDPYMTWWRRWLSNIGITYFELWTYDMMRLDDKLPIEER